MSKALSIGYCRSSKENIEWVHNEYEKGTVVDFSIDHDEMIIDYEYDASNPPERKDD